MRTEERIVVTGDEFRIFDIEGHSKKLVETFGIPNSSGFIMAQEMDECEF